MGAFAIITDAEKRVLLCLRQDYDLWNLPGGGVEHGEAPWDCVVREVKEETGLDVVVERLIGLYAKSDSNDLVFSYQCQVISGTIQTGEESKAIQYFHLDELPTNIIQKQVERIKDYFSDYPNIVMAKQ